MGLAQSRSYTSADGIGRVLSTTARDMRLDDDLDGSADSGLIDDIITDATEEINFFLDDLHSEDTLADHPWVQTTAAWIGAKLLCERRGNAAPQAIVDEVERRMKRLELMASRVMHLPRAPTLAGRSPGPSMSNFEVDGRYRERKIRVSRRSSTGGASQIEQDLDRQGDFYE